MTHRLVTNQHGFNGHTLTSEADYDTILRILDDEIKVAGPGADPFKTALRAVAEVRAVAQQHGWRAGPAERLATYAALVYGALLKEAAADVRLGR